MYSEYFKSAHPNMTLTEGILRDKCLELFKLTTPKGE